MDRITLIKMLKTLKRKEKTGGKRVKKPKNKRKTNKKEYQ